MSRSRGITGASRGCRLAPFYGCGGHAAMRVCASSGGRFDSSPRTCEPPEQAPQRPSRAPERLLSRDSGDENRAGRGDKKASIGTTETDRVRSISEAHEAWLYLRREALRHHRGLTRAGAGTHSAPSFAETTGPVASRTSAATDQGRPLSETSDLPSLRSGSPADPLASGLRAVPVERARRATGSGGASQDGRGRTHEYAARCSRSVLLGRTAPGLGRHAHRSGGRSSSARSGRLRRAEVSPRGSPGESRQ